MPPQKHQTHARQTIHTRNAVLRNRVGSANTRTYTQQKLANNYTKVIVEQAHDNGSINMKDDPDYNKYSKSGYGGCGGILIPKDMNTQTPRSYFREKVDTNDPQKAELQGMLRALQLAEQTHVQTEESEFSILCDCKGAVRCINHQYLVPYHYSKTCQKIQEQKTRLERKGIHHEITWIPGHTKYNWNEQADTLAKEAASSWRPSFKPQIYRSLNGLTIRHFSQFSDTD